MCGEDFEVHSSPLSPPRDGLTDAVNVFPVQDPFSTLSPEPSAFSVLSALDEFGNPGRLRKVPLREEGAHWFQPFLPAFPFRPGPLNNNKLLLLRDLGPGSTYPHVLARELPAIRQIIVVAAEHIVLIRYLRDALPMKVISCLSRVGLLVKMFSDIFPSFFKVFLKKSPRWLPLYRCPRL